MMKNFKLVSLPILLAFAVVLFYGTPSFAALGKIAGTVTDASTGEPLPGVNVQIEGTDMGAATNLDGQYTIINVPPGTYDVQFTYIGYATKVVTGVRASLDQTSTVNAQMSQTVIEGETVTVVATPPPVDKTMTATRVNFSDEVIDNVLPTNDLNDILQSSVTTIDMRGANKSGVGYLIDGVNVTDPFWATGGGTMAYSNVKHDDTPTGNSAGEVIFSRYLNCHPLNWAR